MGRILTVSMPASARIFAAAKADIEEGVKNAKSEADKMFWQRKAGQIERRMKKFTGSLQATPEKPKTIRRKKPNVDQQQHAQQ